MTAVLYGAFGALFVLALVGVGFVLGWKAHGRQQRHVKQAEAEQLTEKQRRELQAEQDAFRQMLGYNIDVAYGVTSPVTERMERGDAI